MRYWWALSVIFVFSLVATAHKAEVISHNFDEKECRMCHLNPKGEPGALRPISSGICKRCHSNIGGAQTHPLDIFPAIFIPEDMPLVNKKLSCITCHYVHKASKKSEASTYFRLRRPGKVLFCNSCHEIDYKKHSHLYYENIHEYSNIRLGRGLPFDLYTLQCVECHERYIDNYISSSSLRQSRDFRSSVSHPIGNSFTRIARRYPYKFNQVSNLSGKIRLFDGKIGCGTCHNAFSKEKFMLVIRNDRSELCFECHKK